MECLLQKIYLTGTTVTVSTQLNKLVEFYPEHIAKEDKNFFIAYFTSKEMDDMLNEFWEFDKKLIHEKYR